MSEQLSSTAGQVLSGKEADHAPEKLTGVARASKLVRKKRLDRAVASDNVATKCDDTQNQDEFFNDVLLRFGIQI